MKLFEGGNKTTKKRPGRKPKNRPIEYKRGYSAGFRRAERKALGQIPITRKSKDKLKSEDYQKGMKDGIAAGKRFYGTGKGNRG